jgi:MFS family permease
MLAAMGKNMETEYLALKIEFMVEFKLSWTAYISAAAAIGGIIAGFTLGKMADKCRPMQLLIPLLALTAALTLAQGACRDLTVFGVVIPGVWLLLISRFLAFVAGGGIEPVLQRLLARITPPERRGGVFGFAMTCRMLGTMLGSLTSGIIFYHFGANKVFYGGSILFFLVIPLICVIFPVIKRQFPESMDAGESAKKSGVSN